MDSSKIVFLINDQVKLIKVSYEPSASAKPYAEESAQNGYLFKTMIQDLAVGDFVVVETGTRYGMTVCKVEAIDLDVDFDDGKPLKWAVQRVDAEGFKATIAAEQEAINAAKRAELKRKRNELRQGIFAEHAEMLEGLTLKTASLPAE